MTDFNANAIKKTAKQLKLTDVFLKSNRQTVKNIEDRVAGKHFFLFC